MITMYLSRVFTAVALLGLIAAAAVAQPAVAPLSPTERALIAQSLRDTEEAAAVGEDDSALAAAVVRHATLELGQRVRPTAIDRMWTIEPPRRDVAAEFSAARASGRLGPWLQALPPPYRQYRALTAAERRYQVMVQAGGWPVLSAKAKLREGDRDPQVTALRARLAAEGYGQATAPELDLFDAALKAALIAFQKHHGLPEDGVLGADTRAALNVSAEARLQQIDANLERWRWMPRSLPAERMMIDIAGARAALFRGGQPTLRMKVVVGDPRHHTPMFASNLNAVVLNPPWKVPPSIAAKEILPKAARDRGYLARNNFVIANGRVTQLPGPKNSLGEVKFDLPSPFGVYLHDTPVKNAFARPNRALSHGCMRLEKPHELAVILLGGQGWTPEQMEAAIAAGATRRVDLKITVPLYVTYWTVVADSAGELDFRPDVYGWDKKLMAALAPKREERAALPRAAADCTETAK